ncbi:hypothetical protein B0H12DRAFT_1236705 [Mycena haematopus]|nr:hypothetical protein B0H12DRAFT_1236705 [Mycena haematopus]
MASTLFSMRSIVLDQRERTMNSTKADVERFIEESELKITSLESQISALAELRDCERACIAALTYLISPIHTLPVLLAEIFELSIGDYTPMDVFPISQVCSDWRQVSHSTPRLWKDTVVCLQPSRSGKEQQIYMDGLKAWLARSAPLTIPVYLVELGSGSGDHYIPGEVLRTAPRWRSLHFNSTYPSLFLISQLAESKLVESLEELSLGSITAHVDPTTFPSFTIVPQLRKLSVHFSTNALPTLMPWAQLTHLDLRADFPNIALDVLGQCPNLLRVAVTTAGWDVLPEARQDIIPLSHLHFLSFYFSGWAGHVTPFLDRLSTPVLDNLCLQMGDASIAWTQASLTAFQLRAPNFTQLTLHCSSLTSDDLRTAIRHAPFLTRLHLTWCLACIDDALIDALCYKAGVIPLVPNLRILRLENIGHNFTDNILAGMIV